MNITNYKFNGDRNYDIFEKMLQTVKPGLVKGWIHQSYIYLAY